jgi:hypothetical protein
MSFGNFDYTVYGNLSPRFCFGLWVPWFGLAYRLICLILLRIWLEDWIRQETFSIVSMCCNTRLIYAVPRGIVVNWNFPFE